MSAPLQGWRSGGNHPQANRHNRWKREEVHLQDLGTMQ